MMYTLKSSFFIKMLIAFSVLLLIILIAVGFGAANTTIKDVCEAIIGQSGGEYYDVLREIRFPRVLAAFFVGSALAVAGTIMQGMTRNPLADPGLLGLTSGANLALAITLAFVPTTPYIFMIAACFVGAAIGMIIVFGIGTSSKNGLSPLKLVLAGAAVSLFLQAIADGIGIVFKLSKNISMWTAGGLIGTTWDALIVVPVIGVALFLALFFGRQLTILSLNEELAVGLGQNVKRTRLLLMVLIVVLAGSAVALVGNLSFVGLIIPHIVRRLVGSDYRFILPMSILAGGIFMIFADFLSRMINSPFETPVVALVSLIGLPFFLFLVKKGGRRFV
ncbi:FecCD family ABC transporter permease [Solibacillus sp. FSL H8-0538]|uniref:FecCD family ABC transporter permease n=1 Tax=Solibacillus sp. FSL H8-0538 TaxID=2921400 RepID=UPI0040470290